MATPDTTAVSSADFTLTLSGVSKAFGRRRICADISLKLQIGDQLAVVGPNGSGKTTFLKILCGLLRPDGGTIAYEYGGKKVERGRWPEHVGLVAPDLALYDELTALENVRFINKIGGWGKTKDELMALLAEMGLAGREHDLLGTFSSGMKQRLKYAAALVKTPPLLLLDEPTANFDESGTAIFRQVIQQQRSVGICVLATNDKREAELAERQIVMGR
ncbi:ATP-binding cassette domain-containing protein [Candidatus Zixiibacteriota bacterium]